MSSPKQIATTGITRRRFASGLGALLICGRGRCSIATRSAIRFGVFVLFEPRQLILQADKPLLLDLDDQRQILEPGHQLSILHMPQKGLAVRLGDLQFTPSRLRARSTSGEAGSFILSVPRTSRHESIRRRYRGTISVRSDIHGLVPVVAMDLETAVSSIVGAESAAAAPHTFLMAQAVASRSFLLGARTGHAGFDFCDTTHCQFLREAPPPGSEVHAAVALTAGLCVTFDGGPVAAMYSRSCSGRTHSLAELELPASGYPHHPASGYPYYSVSCEFCRHHPEKWVRSSRHAPNTERRRIEFNRIYGWSAIPSVSFTEHGTFIEGRGIGHGIGLCQRGAAAMASKGASMYEILAHYYPNTAVAAYS